MPEGEKSEQPFLSLIIPAYNEKVRLPITLGHMRDYFRHQPYRVEYIVVDDGSQDGTAQVAEAMADQLPSLKVLVNAPNRGKGYSVRRGVAASSGRIIGYVDADDKTPIEEIEKMLPLLEEGYDLAYGSRGSATSMIEVKQPLYRQWGSKMFGVIMHGVVGLHGVIDTQCGFKFFKRDAAIRLFEAQKIDRHLFDVEILCLAQRWGYRMKEQPIRWRNDPDSRLKVFSHSFIIMFDLLKIRWLMRSIPWASKK